MNTSLSNMDPMLLSIASQLMANSTPSTRRRSLMEGMGPAILRGEQMQRQAAERKRLEDDRRKREAAMARLPMTPRTISLLENEASQGATLLSGEKVAPYTPDVPGAVRKAQQGVFASAYPEQYGTEMAKKIFAEPKPLEKPVEWTRVEGGEIVTLGLDPMGNEYEIARAPRWQAPAEGAPTYRTIQVGNENVVEDWNGTAWVERSRGLRDAPPAPSIANEILLPIARKVMADDPDDPLTTGEEAALRRFQPTDPIAQMIALMLEGDGLGGGGDPETAALREAREAIQAGADRAVIEDRLRAEGYDPGKI